jgi:hypothetical protein
MDEKTRQRFRADYELHSDTFAGLKGADSLIEQYGNVPDFHDSEVQDLHLSLKFASTVRISNLFPDIYSRGRIFVTLTIDEILDIDLDGFSPQNVLGGLRVRPVTSRPDRERFYPRKRTDGDLEIELDAIYGIGGVIVCRGVRIGWTKDRIARKLVKKPQVSPLLGQ